MINVPSIQTPGFASSRLNGLWPNEEAPWIARYLCLLAVLLGLTVFGASLSRASNTGETLEPNLFGRLVIDSSNDNTSLSSLRFGSDFTVSASSSLTLEFDPRGSEIEFQNFHMSFGREQNFFVGKKKLVRGFSSATSSLFSSFVSRPEIVRKTGGLQRRFGLQANVGDNNWLFQPAIFSSNGGRSLTKLARAVFRQQLDLNRYWHIGLSAEHADHSYRFGDEVAEKYLALEGFYKTKNWYVAAEGMRQSSPFITTSGFYVDTAVLFGGEFTHRQATGVLANRTVDHPLTSNGPGAWEIAFRQETGWTEETRRPASSFSSSEASVIWYPIEALRLIAGYTLRQKISAADPDRTPKFRLRLQLFY